LAGSGGTGLRAFSAEAEIAKVRARRRVRERRGMLLRLSSDDMPRAMNAVELLVW